MWHVVKEQHADAEPRHDDASAVADGQVGHRYRRVVLGEATDLPEAAREVAWPGARAVVSTATSAPTPARCAGHGTTEALPREARSPMAARVLAVHVAPNDVVEAGAVLVLLEAMKMEHPVVARATHKIARVHVAVGDLVAHGQILCSLADAP